MPAVDCALTGLTSEPQFASSVDALATTPDGRGQLLELLREDHHVYAQRDRAAVVRMRGWILTALARAPVADAAVPFLIEELESGADGHLVAAAARALRARPAPDAAVARVVVRAVDHVRARDEPVSFDHYGAYATAASTTVIGELLATLEWLGAHAQSMLPEIDAFDDPATELPPRYRGQMARVRAAIGAGSGDADCCTLNWSGLRLWSSSSGRTPTSIASTRFEDHDGASVTFGEFFSGRPTIVVFFYTRCDNPRKCSTTLMRLAATQRLLESMGLADQIQTAAITYDPAFDLPERLRRYGRDRGVRMDAAHRLLRAPDGMHDLQRHFGLGVNFVGSLVNRHRLEVYVLDRQGHIAASFERVAWNERAVVDCAAGLIRNGASTAAAAARITATPALSTLASLGVALFPKCPLCWATYLSASGIAGVVPIPYSPWLPVVLVSGLLVNSAAIGWRSRISRSWGPLALAGAGALAILASQVNPLWQWTAWPGVALTFAGSLWSVLLPRAAATAGRRRRWLGAARRSLSVATGAR